MDDPLERYLPELVMGDIGGALDPGKKGDVTACRKKNNVKCATSLTDEYKCDMQPHKQLLR